MPQIPHGNSSVHRIRYIGLYIGCVWLQCLPVLRSAGLLRRQLCVLIAAGCVPLRARFNASLIGQTQLEQLHLSCQRLVSLHLLGELLRILCGLSLSVDDLLLRLCEALLKVFEICQGGIILLVALLADRATSGRCRQLANLLCGY